MTQEAEVTDEEPGDLIDGKETKSVRHPFPLRPRGLSRAQTRTHPCLLFLVCESVLLFGTPSLLAPCAFGQAQAPGGQIQLSDNFSSGVSLNTALWTTQSDLLKRVAAVGEGGNKCFSLANNFIPPILKFGPSGMEMSGTNGWQQFTGIQSLRTFSPPFIFQTTVTGTVANGNPFEIFFISTDSRQWFSLYGNVNPANQPYTSIHLGCESFFERPAVGVPYTINISVNVDGLFSVSLSTGSRTLATKSLQVGTGPFYLILGQGEGWPNTGGTKNVAIWRSVTVTSGAQVQTSVVTIAANPSIVAAGGQATISGTVRDSNGNAEPGATVTLSASEGGVAAPPTSVTTNADGSYSLPLTAPPTPGTVKLQASLPGTSPLVTSSTHLTVAGPNAVAKVWVAQAIASSDQRSAGHVTLAWNAPGSTSCALSVSPSIQDLAKGVSVPVACTGSGAQWTGSIPPNLPTPTNPMPPPVPYTFTLAATGCTSQMPCSVTVYALPNLSYGAGGLPFSSLNNNAVYSPTLAACSPPFLGCWIQFGYSGCTASGSSCLYANSMQNGVALAGIVGVNFTFAGDYDSEAADYGPFTNLPSGYKEYLSVSPQVQYAAVQVCVAPAIVGEGGEDIGYQIQIEDSSGDAYSSPLQEDSCAHLIAGAGGEVLQGGIGALQFLQGAPKLLSDASSLEDTVLNSNSSFLAQGSQALQVFDDLRVGPASLHSGSINDLTWPWSPVIDGGRIFEFAVNPEVVLGGAGVNVAAGGAVVTQSRLAVSGIAVPSSPINQQTANSPPRAQQSILTQQLAIILEIQPSTIQVRARLGISGTIRRGSGNPVPRTMVQLTAVEGGTQSPPVTVTTGQDGSFQFPFTAPPSPGDVIIRARIVGVANSPTATANLRVVPKR